MVEAATFRDVLSQWPSGVTVVTTVVDGRRHGMTASSFSSVSLDPPLISICLDRKLFSHGLIESTGFFGVSVLAKDQAEVARRFAGQTGEVDRFAGETWSTAETGAPLLDSSLGWLDCRVVHAHPGGDHTIFVGEVLAGHAARRTAPLLFHSRGWGQFADVLPDVATLADSRLVGSLTGHGADGEWIRRTEQRVRATGVRTRVLDLSLPTGSSLTPPSLGRNGAMLTDARQCTAMVASADQAREAVDRGVGVIELGADARDGNGLERAAELIQAAGNLDTDGRVVILRDAFTMADRDALLWAVETLIEAGATEICLDDTRGAATPLEVRATLQDAVGIARPVPLRVRLHDNDRLGLVKALTALKSGVHHFDTTLGGLDGAVATEDLVRLLGTLDVDTPVDAVALGRLADRVREHLGTSGEIPALRTNGVAAPATPPQPTPLPTP
ncbi:flavin reductase [Mumia xiangluensis]|uniref:Flavin reductase n=1 Tax=Mumia xiangluensis TaxID=1678900 RepID=A0ABW1QQM4_9ACTN